jgi:DNA-binding response OmpR family regulator
VETRHAPDARRWLNIYAELVAFHEDLYERLRAEAAHMQTATHRLQASDLAPLQREIERLQNRQSFWQGRCLELAGLEIDHAAHLLRYGTQEVHLTGREIQLLEVLLRNPGKRFRADALVTQAWGGATRLRPEQLRTYIVRVRRKLAEAGVPAEVETHPRQGYALVFD